MLIYKPCVLRHQSSMVNVSEHDVKNYIIKRWNQNRSAWCKIRKYGTRKNVTFSPPKNRYIMKRKFEQWWSSIPPISTRRTFIFHPSRTHCSKHKLDHDIWCW